MEYNREYENEKWGQLSVGDSHGKSVVEEELEVSLWRFSHSETVLITLLG
jgi:hypothetical protein